MVVAQAAAASRVLKSASKGQVGWQRVWILSVKGLCHIWGAVQRKPEVLGRRWAEDSCSGTALWAKSV